MRAAPMMICGLCLILSIPAMGNAESFSILEPPDNKLVESESVLLVLKLEQDFAADTLDVFRNNQRIARKTVAAGKRFICTDIEVKWGLNTIRVDALKSGVVADARTLSVYYRSDVSRKYGENPPRFQPIVFHQGDRDALCRPCHSMEVSLKDRQPDKPEDSSCYSCHKSITAHKYVHGPASMWMCFTCHDPDSAPARYAVKRPDQQSCFSCHVILENRMNTGKFVHGPAATGMCTICHDPHASDNHFWTRKPTTRLCISCHEGMLKHPFKVMGLVNRHPMTGVQDPMNPGHELTCASCHNPHAADSPYLFAFETSDKLEFCNKCHKK